VSFALFVDCLEVFLYGFMDFSVAFMVLGGRMFVGAWFLMAIDECVCSGGW
jgi:hypothetical protein